MQKRSTFIFSLALVLVVVFGGALEAGNTIRPAPELEEAIKLKFGPEALDVFRKLGGSKPLKEHPAAQALSEHTRNEMYNWLKYETQKLNNKTIEFYKSQKTLTAIRYAEQANLITEKVLGNQHPAFFKIQNFLTELYILSGRLDDAETGLKKLKSLTINKYGQDHPAVADVLNKQAKLYSKTRRLQPLEGIYKEIIRIFTKAHGEKHPSVVTAVKNLALLYDSMGRLADAEPMYIKGISLAEEVYGKAHPAVASGLNNLGLLYYSSGKYGDVEALYKRALRIYETAYGRDHPAISTLLNNLAVFYTSTGRLDEAETYYKQALLIDEGLFGKDHTNVMSDLNNLANLYKEKKLYAKAEPLYKRALAIGSKNLASNDPAVAANSNNLGMTYYLTGRLDEAEVLYKKALSIGIKTLGEEHQDVAAWKNNLALLYAAQGRAEESYKLFRDTMELEYTKREDVFTFLPEDQKLEYMQRTEGSIHAFISLTATMLQDHPEAVNATLDAWLKWKGSVMESMQRYAEAAMGSENTLVRQKFQQLIGVRKKLAKYKLSGPKGSSIDSYNRIVRQLEGQKRELESQLSRLSKDFALNKTAGEASVESIAAMLPEGSAYIDYAYIESYDFNKRKKGKPAYYVFVLLPGEKPVAKIYKLVKPSKLNLRIKTYLTEIRSPIIFGGLPRMEILDSDSAKLYEMLVKPIEHLIKDRDHLLISPDGNLNLIPFEVLIDADGKYLIEDHLISYVNAGRDIMRFGSAANSSGKAIIMADPDYDFESLMVAKDMKSKPHGAGMGMSRLHFDRLPETREEAADVEKVLTSAFNLDVRKYEGSKAVDEVLFKMASPPRIMHLATHAYFLHDDTESGERTNPMLRSGIVLAGANQSLITSREYGVVSAYKAMALNLGGTDLVVLSACDTGTGEVQQGEGVFGLRRSFIVAGAKSLVMSLWSVPSNETRDLMKTFYNSIAAGKGKARALREAKLEIMKTHPNPFFWGAFIIAGDPGRAKGLTVEKNSAR